MAPPEFGPERRIDGHLKVTGRLPYAADLRVPGSLAAAVIRSPYPHARILGLDSAIARRLPGVRAVLTGADVPSVLTGRGMRDVPLLALDRVRFAGEIVAAVAADTAEQAERAARTIEVAYEPLAAVFDPLEALAPGAPVLHAEPWSYERSLRGRDRPPNEIASARRCVGGSIEAALRASDHVLEHSFRTPRVHQGYLEPNCCIVHWLPDATLHVWSCNKSPYALRAQLAATFDLPLEHVVVHSAAIGGDFGAKGGPLDIPLCLELSRRTGRPVRLVRSSTDELTAGSPAPASMSTVRLGVSRAGCIQAFAMRVVLNAGAYGGYAASNLASMIGGTPYRLPVADVEVTRVYTNEVPNSSMRAPGMMQVVFAVEAMMDLVARELRLDPFELRRRNLLRTGETSVIGVRWPEHRGHEVLDRAQSAVRPHGPALPSLTRRIGRGVAVYDHPTHAPGQTSLRLRWTASGDLEAEVPVQETGTGAHTIVQRVLAHELQLDPARVRVRYVASDALPFDFGVGGQRVTATLVNASVTAARALREGGATEALVETPAAPLLEGGVINYCVQVADVTVDTETGQVQVDELLSVHDVAAIIDPVSHQGQIEGGVAMGLGFALSEDLALIDGQVTAAQLGEYKMPCAPDMPPLRVVLVPGGQGVGSWNTKAIGEMGNVAVAPAIANAVSNALGVCMDSLPLTAERVLNAADAAVCSEK